MLIASTEDDYIISIDCPSCGRPFGFMESHVTKQDKNNGTIWCCYCRHEIGLTGMSGVCEHDEDVEG